MTAWICISGGTCGGALIDFRVGCDLVDMLPYMFYLGCLFRVDAYTLVLCFLLSLYLYYFYKVMIVTEHAAVNVP